MLRLCLPLTNAGEVLTLSKQNVTTWEKKCDNLQIKDEVVKTLLLYAVVQANWKKKDRISCHETLLKAESSIW